MGLPALPATVTLTNAKTGAGVTVAGVVLNGVLRWTVDAVANTLSVSDSSDNVKVFDISAQATLTWTVSGNKYSLTIAN